MLTFLLALAAPASAFPVVERITAPEAARRVAQCGLGPVTTHYDRDLEEEVLVATRALSATDEQLECAYKVTGFYYTLELSPNVQRRFDAMLKAKAEVTMKAEARRWLSARGLLNRVPTYQRGVTNDAAFTRQVEALCGRQAKGAFQSEYGFHALSPHWVSQHGFPAKRDQTDTMSCLISVMAVAGYEIGLIGNAALAPAK
jgi:hypothetical protein